MYIVIDSEQRLISIQAADHIDFYQPIFFKGDIKSIYTKFYDINVQSTAAEIATYLTNKGSHYFIATVKNNQGKWEVNSTLSSDLFMTSSMDVIFINKDGNSEQLVIFVPKADADDSSITYYHYPKKASYTQAEVCLFNKSLLLALNKYVSHGLSDILVHEPESICLVPYGCIISVPNNYVNRFISQAKEAIYDYSFNLLLRDGDVSDVLGYLLPTSPKAYFKHVFRPFREIKDFGRINSKVFIDHSADIESAIEDYRNHQVLPATIIAYGVGGVTGSHDYVDSVHTPVLQLSVPISYDEFDADEYVDSNNVYLFEADNYAIAFDLLSRNFYATSVISKLASSVASANDEIQHITATSQHTAAASKAISTRIISQLINEAASSFLQGKNLVFLVQDRFVVVTRDAVAATILSSNSSLTDISQSGAVFMLSEEDSSHNPDGSITLSAENIPNSLWSRCLVTLSSLSYTKTKIADKASSCVYDGYYEFPEHTRSCGLYSILQSYCAELYSEIESRIYDVINHDFTLVKYALDSYMKYPMAEYGINCYPVNQAGVGDGCCEQNGRAVVGVDDSCISDDYGYFTDAVLNYSNRVTSVVTGSQLALEDPSFSGNVSSRFKKSSVTFNLRNLYSRFRHCVALETSGEVIDQAESTASNDRSGEQSMHSNNAVVAFKEGILHVHSLYSAKWSIHICDNAAIGTFAQSNHCARKKSVVPLIRDYISNRLPHLSESQVDNIYDNGDYVNEDTYKFLTFLTRAGANDPISLDAAQNASSDGFVSYYVSGASGFFSPAGRLISSTPIDGELYTLNPFTSYKIDYTTVNRSLSVTVGSVVSAQDIYNSVEAITNIYSSELMAAVVEIILKLRLETMDLACYLDGFIVSYRALPALVTFNMVSLTAYNQLSSFVADCLDSLSHEANNSVGSDVTVVSTTKNKVLEKLYACFIEGNSRSMRTIKRPSYSSVSRLDRLNSMDAVEVASLLANCLLEV